jgi:phosphatidylethanolamine/phosphatidyl-N-methylethanolamine N-methyltransferase
MLNAFAGKLKTRFAEEIRFLEALKREPKAVGAVWPTGQVMARSMASVVDGTSGLPVLELGPGTGIITRYILDTGLAADKLHAVEFTPGFVRELKMRFPDSHIHHGDAFNLDEALGEARSLTFDCAVSALPLLNFPMEKRTGLIMDVLSRLPVGRPFIQFSYGPLPPVPAKTGAFAVKHHDYVLRNLPPARIWTYTRPQN